MATISALFDELRAVAVQTQKDAETLYDESVARSSQRRARSAINRNQAQDAEKTQLELCEAFADRLETVSEGVQRQTRDMCQIADSVVSVNDLVVASRAMLELNAARIDAIEKFVMQYGYIPPRTLHSDEVETPAKQRYDCHNLSPAQQLSREWQRTPELTTHRLLDEERSVRASIGVTRTFGKSNQFVTPVRHQRDLETIPQTPNTPTLEEFGLSQAHIAQALGEAGNASIPAANTDNSPPLEAWLASQSHKFPAKKLHPEPLQESPDRLAEISMGFQGLTGIYSGRSAVSRDDGSGSSSNAIARCDEKDPGVRDGSLLSVSCDAPESDAVEKARYFSSKDYGLLPMFIRSQLSETMLHESMQRLAALCVERGESWIAQQDITDVITLDVAKAKAVTLALSNLKRIRFERRQGAAGYTVL